MREWGKLSTAFWERGSGKRLRGDHEAALAAIHIVTSHWANSIGVFYIPIASIAHHLGSPLEGASEALQRVIEAGFCEYDLASELVWVPNHAEIEIGRALKAADNRKKSIQEMLDSLGNHPYAAKFWEKYGEAYGLEKPKPLASPFEGAFDPLGPPSEAKAKQSKAKQEQGIGITAFEQKSKTPSAPAVAGYREAVDAWFENYKQAHKGESPPWGPVHGKQLKNILAKCKPGELPALIEQYFHGPYPEAIKAGHPLSDGFACLAKTLDMLRADLANPERRARAATLSFQIRRAERNASIDDELEKANRILAERGIT